MTRRLIHGFRVLLMLALILHITQMPASAAKTYTLDELLTLGQTQSVPVRTLLNQLANETVNLEILQLNYQPKLTLNVKPLTLSPDQVNDQLRLQTQAGISASIKMPFGLEASTSATLSDPFNDKRKLDYTFSVKYELLPGVKADSVQIQIEGKKQTLENIAWGLKSKLEEAEIEIINQYYATLLIQKKLVLAKANLSAAENDLQVSQELWKRGSAVEKDVLEKETAVHASQINVEQLTQQYQSNLNSLLTYVGIIPEKTSSAEVVQLADSSDTLQATPLKAPETLPTVEQLADLAIQNRLGHSDVFQSLEAAKDELEQIQNWPVISAQFDYRPQSTTNNNTQSKWSLGINTSYAFGDSGKVKLEREKKLREITELELQLAETRNEIYHEVQTRITNVKIAYLQYQNAELELKKVKLDQAILDEQYKRGLITEAEQVNGAQNVKMKELDLLQKLLDYQVTYWKLQQYVYLQLEQNGVTV